MKWPFQAYLDVLVASGFATENVVMTRYWTRYNQDMRTEQCVPIYDWTKEGREACPRYRYSTPMVYADAMQRGCERHCIVCGRETFRKHVAVKWDGSKRTVCLDCQGTYEARQEKKTP